MPKVLIIGAGIGGLFLAILLEQLNIPYHIFERASEIRPLGAAMTLGPNILPVFEQLGLLSELEKVSLPLDSLDFYDSELRSLGSADFGKYKELPRLYEILRNRVPSEKISFSKKVLRVDEYEDEVTIYCSDKTTYDGGIIVGADGAYSGVRQSLYKRLSDKGVLPKSDLEDLTIGFVSVVGTAIPKFPKIYTPLKKNSSTFSQVIGHDKRSWGVFSVADKQISWALSIQLSNEEAKHQQFRNSEWGPESCELTLRDFHKLPCPWGGTMGEIFDATPRESISKVFLEEKLFKTWYHGKTVLIGDGAVNAIQDAVALANCFYSMEEATPANIDAAFKEYYKQRFNRASYQFERSEYMSKVMVGQTWSERSIRHLFLNYMPAWVQKRRLYKNLENCPQVAWLPFINQPKK
ncbi:hypothetical protein BGZ76_007993 [Entomortierella beljakovae]|nr:hypothetical protein BGZ76_007993 [Entomortierella beljakovae]